MESQRKPSLNPLKQLAGQTAIYGLSSIVGRFINFLLVPLYAHIFLTSEFGIFAEMYAYLAFLLIILTYGMETAFFRFSQLESGRSDRVFSTSLLSLASTTALFLGGMLIFRQQVAELLRYPSHPEYIVWLSVTIGLDALNTIPFARLRSENKAFRFAFLKLIAIGINISLILFFLVLSPWLVKTGSPGLSNLISRVYDPGIGVGYVFLSNMITSIITSLMLLPVMLRTKITFSANFWKQMLIYGLPLALAGFAGVINEALDKLLLKYMLPADISMSHVGIYSACYKLSVLMNIFIQAFRFAAEPFFFAHAARDNARQLYADVLKYFVIACLLIFLGIMLFIDVVQYFVGADYREGLGVVPVLLLANMFLGIYMNLSIWYKLTGQTLYGAWIAVAGAGITILLNILWIPVWGYHGSAWATLFCYVSMAIISYWLGQKHFTVPYQTLRILLFILSAISIYLLHSMLPELPVLASLGIRIVALLVFGLAVLAIDPELRKLARHTFRRA